MSNPLFQMFGQQAAPQSQGPFNNPMQMIQQFNQFRNNFQGNPQQKVQEMLNTGQMTQEQFGQLSAMAQTFMQLLGGRR